MQNMISKAVFAAAIAGVALAPVAVEAKTRATGNAAIYAPSAAPGAGRSAKGSRASGTEIVVAVLGVAAVVGGVVVATQSGNDAPIVPPPPPPASPGA